MRIIIQMLAQLKQQDQEEEGHLEEGIQELKITIINGNL
jgi:hypothetical protein